MKRATQYRVSRLGFLTVAVLAFVAVPTALAGGSHHGGGDHHGRGGHHGRGFRDDHHGHESHRGGHGLNVSLHFGHRDLHRGQHGVRRHHGLGHGGYFYYDGVRRHHGLGHGGYYGSSVRRYHGLGYGLSYGGAYFYGSYGEPYISYGGLYIDSSSLNPRGYVAVGSRVTPIPPDGAAWVLLSQGDARAALSAFASQAEAAPSAGKPKAGYALAAAMLGDHDVAMWAMRRAFRVDADSLHYLPIDEHLRDRMHTLLEHYQYQASHPEGKVEALFMTAALHFLLHEDADAAAAIESAIAYGDADVSAGAMHTLLVAR